MKCQPYVSQEYDFHLKLHSEKAAYRAKEEAFKGVSDGEAQERGALAAWGFQPSLP